MPKRRYSIDGEAWVPVAVAAKLLGTNAVGVRKLIAEGNLHSRQSRLGSSIVIVNLKQIADLRAEREQWRAERRPKKQKLSAAPASVASPPPTQRIPGHREQYALPMHDAGLTPPWRRDR